MRFALYPRNAESFRPPFEIIVETDLIKQLLVEGEITPEEISKTLTCAIKHVQDIVQQYVASKAEL